MVGSDSTWRATTLSLTPGFGFPLPGESWWFLRLRSCFTLFTSRKYRRKHRRIFHHAFHPAAAMQFRPHSLRAARNLLKRFLDKPNDILGNIRQCVVLSLLSVASLIDNVNKYGRWNNYVNCIRSFCLTWERSIHPDSRESDTPIRTGCCTRKFSGRLTAMAEVCPWMGAWSRLPSIGERVERSGKRYGCRTIRCCSENHCKLRSYARSKTANYCNGRLRVTLRQTSRLWA